MPQYESIPMVREEAVARALSCVGSGVYELGCGGRNPASPSPFVASKRGRPGRVYVDCSGFAAWVLGYDRVQDLGTDEEQWYDTEAIFEDATSAKRMFTTVPRRWPVLAGDVIVYPDAGRKQGHIGVITSVLPGFKRLGKSWEDNLAVTHASTGGSACVRTSSARLWRERGGSILRYVHWADASCH